MGHDGSDFEDPGSDPAGASSAGAPSHAVFQALALRAECLQTGPISTGTLARLACDAILQAVLTTTSGAVLSLGRAVRTDHADCL